MINEFLWYFESFRKLPALFGVLTLQNQYFDPKKRKPALDSMNNSKQSHSRLSFVHMHNPQLISRQKAISIHDNITFGYQNRKILYIQKLQPSAFRLTYALKCYP